MTFRPDPAAMRGTYDTTDTAGPSARFGRIEDTARVFDAARADDLAGALREMDAGDPPGDRARVTADAARTRRRLEQHAGPAG